MSRLGCPRARKIEDRLLAPIPLALAFEKFVSGTLQALIASLFVLPVARLDHDGPAPPRGPRRSIVPS